jgi:multimeric flavodoxin WrbA
LIFGFSIRNKNLDKKKRKMKIVILDGQSELENKRWSAYMSTLVVQLQQKGHEVNHFVLKDFNIHHCTGCFGCWVKTPGICVIDDDSREINRQSIQADFILWASPLVMGFPTYHLKKKLDRSIPLIHPYFEMVNGEVHHLPRYEKYPLFGLLLQPEKMDTQTDIDMVNQIFSRTALNIKSRLAFAATTDLNVEDIASKIENARNLIFRPQLSYTTKKETGITPPKNLLVINGSPRGKKGNTPFMLQKLVDGFLSVGGTSCEMLHLALAKDKQAFADLYIKADCVLLGFPLYTDGMPGIVKEYIELLCQFEGKVGNPPMGFLVQSGFPESIHSRYVERYLSLLTDKLNSPYLGSLVRGGGGAVRSTPAFQNRKLFNNLHQLGVQLARDGEFQTQTIRSLVSLEKISPRSRPIYKFILKVIFNQFWDSQLKENGVFDKRFDQPYL